MSPPLGAAQPDEVAEVGGGQRSLQCEVEVEGDVVVEVEVEVSPLLSELWPV